ncbi:sensor histidine kinase [Actinoplanes aureus]|uniref:sensor histidine kinase n=1 Tax=Actinoplanes aureus TaxID=2792083 RepID=UPI0028159730|nr:histidine kinase [Actinoplanes aureus]
MFPSLRTRLTASWRAGELTVWGDLALVVLLTVLSVALTVERGDAPHPDSMVFWPGPQDFPTGERIRFEEEPSTASVLATNLLATAPLLGRRRWPLLCFAAQVTVLGGLDVEANLANLAAVLIGTYALALHGRSVPVAMGALLATCVLIAATSDDTWPQLPEWAGGFFILVPIGLLGVTVRAARSRALASEQRAEALEREQQAATRLAVAEERARIARELHDVVSHHVSVMTIQAGAAGKVMDARPDMAREALSAVEASGRETMAELRHLMGVLAPGPDDDLLRPQPGLDQLAALVENVRRAGQPVTLHATPVSLPHGLDLAAYRVVQEALTNALRHAPGAPTEVTVTADGDDLVISVENDAPPPRARPAASTGSGAGLLGLTERLRLYEGTLEAGRRVGGGFQVRARIPLNGRAS